MVNIAFVVAALILGKKIGGQKNWWAKKLVGKKIGGLRGS
jgi:hypothetical protein